MTDIGRVCHHMAEAIGRRDVVAIRALLAPGFTHRTHGGVAVDAEAFLAAIAAIPGTIEFVRLDSLDLDLTPLGALATGVQTARVVVDGQVVEERRGYVDWLVPVDGAWRFQAAVDLSVV